MLPLNTYKHRHNRISPIFANQPTEGTSQEGTSNNPKERMLPFFCFFAFLAAVVVEGGPTKSNPSVLPITMDVLVHQQYIRISLLKEMPATAKLYCIPLKKGRPEPSLGYFKEDVQIHWENVIQPNTPQPYIIETDEVMEYDRLSCVYAERDQYFGPKSKRRSQFPVSIPQVIVYPLG